MTISSIANNQLQKVMTRLSSGQRINSAADDAAGLGIMEKMESQIRGLEQGTRNTLDMQSLVNTAEGGLSTINDSLQRIRELTLQAGSGIMNDDDRANIQREIDQLTDHINSTASNTEFNGKKLLDGSFNDANTASDAAGRGPDVSIGNMDSSILLQDGTGSGLEGLVGSSNIQDTIDTNLRRIDNAMAAVTSQRTYLGAMSNRFDYTVASNQITNLNQAAARSRIRDQDMALGAMQLSKENVIKQYQLQAQKRQQEREQEKNIPILSSIM